MTNKTSMERGEDFVNHSQAEGFDTVYADKADTIILDLIADLKEANRLKDKYFTSCIKLNTEVCDTLGRSLGMHGDMTEVGGGIDDVCVGDEVAETMATHAANKIATITAENESLKEENEKALKYMLELSKGIIESGKQLDAVKLNGDIAQSKLNDILEMCEKRLKH